MAFERIPRLGTFNVAGQTQTANTVISIGIPPWRGGLGAPILYSVDPTRGPNWQGARGAITHITRISVLKGSTVQSVSILRPFNYSTVTTAVAKNTATFILKDDPGVYSTNYKYPSNISTGTAAVADNAIAASDYVAYQLVDGTWIFDTVSSGTFAALVLTTNVPNVTGGGVAAGTPMFFFGVVTDKDPATGAVPPSFNPNVSVVTDISDAENGICASLHQGDPLIAYDPNATAADTITTIGGFFGRI